MSVTLFIQERSGDFNYDEDFTDEFEARKEFNHLKDSLQGYWVETDDGVEVFVPWHRVDHVELIKNEEDGE